MTSLVYRHVKQYPTALEFRGNYMHVHIVRTRPILGPGYEATLTTYAMHGNDWPFLTKAPHRAKMSATIIQ